MLITFDLDDTLIDTTNTLTPFLLERALEKMVSAGLEVEDFAKAKFQLWVLNKRASSSEEALRIFFSLGGYDLAFFPLGMKELTEPDLSQKFPIKLLDGALELLDELKLYKLFLVSRGKESLQLKKLEKAGIDTDRFSKIFISEAVNKGPFYQKILFTENKGAGELIVIGDRVQGDLRPAKELGAHTIHMRSGRGLNYEGSKEWIDYEIGSLKEIPEILHRLKGAYV